MEMLTKLTKTDFKVIKRLLEIEVSENKKELRLAIKTAENVKNQGGDHYRYWVTRQIEHREKIIKLNKIIDKI